MHGGLVSEASVVGAVCEVASELALPNSGRGGVIIMAGACLLFRRSGETGWRGVPVVVFDVDDKVGPVGLTPASSLVDAI